MKPNLKLVLAATLTLVGLMGRSQAQTTIYLVDLYNKTPYNGNASTDFGISGTVTDVGLNGSTNLTSAGGTYTLGSATLTLNALPAASGPSQHDGNIADVGTAQWLTANDIYEDSATPISFTLSGLTVGDTVTISSLGGYSPNHGSAGKVTVLDGVTQIGTGSTPLTTGDMESPAVQTDAGGTFGLDASFVATSDVYTINFNYTSGEGELSSFEITELGATPEPSTWALMLGSAGILGWVLRSRWRVRQV